MCGCWEVVLITTTTTKALSLTRTHFTRLLPFSFVPHLNSPVNDLLDRGDYTLTEIFDEDDMLQEIKSMNTRLINLYVLQL